VLRHFLSIDRQGSQAWYSVYGTAAAGILAGQARARGRDVTLGEEPDMSGASKGAREFRGHALTHGWDVIYSPFRREGTLAPGNSLTTGDLVERVTVRNRDTAVRIEQTWIAGRKTAYHAEPLAASRARIAAAPRLAAGGRALAAGGGPGGLAVHGDPGREPGR
jgi:hypothetical protein